MTIICDRCGKVLKCTSGKRGTNRDYYQTCADCLLGLSPRERGSHGEEGKEKK